MLLELHVRNLALIEQVDVEFGDGLNIMTGETGAGKSIIIGSVNLALGQKASRDIIRAGAEYAYIELIFSVHKEQSEGLSALDIKPDENGLLVITRKIMPSRSISRINDETVTAAKLRQVTGLLIDIHGQHEHQSLLHAAKHLEILDLYAKEDIIKLKSKLSSVYQEYRTWKTELLQNNISQENRRREADFLQYEIEEIESAALKEGEEETLSELHRKYSNGQKIMQSLSAAYEAVETEGIGRALRQVGDVASYDDEIMQIQNQLYDVEAVLTDVHHAIGAYLDNMSFDEGELLRIESRLDQIRSLQAKYGGTVKNVMSTLAKKKERLERLEHLEEYRQEAEAKYQQSERELTLLCEKLSRIRQEAAISLSGRIQSSLADLNFQDVSFTMQIRRMAQFTANGFDEAEFMISTNPGEQMRPLAMVASGGELSRIMLAIKTVLADTDAIETLIFDEIDTGISGRTAQKVSEKLAIIAQGHQVICITHLPQIAAMADYHYEIEKSNESGRTTTRIHVLSENQMVDELVRLVGGAEITDTVFDSAREMKRLADKMKATLRQ